MCWRKWKPAKKVVFLLIEDSEYTSDELAAKIGVTKRTIERAFISLQNKKVIERIGSKRDGSWNYLCMKTEYHFFAEKWFWKEYNF